MHIRPANDKEATCNSQSDPGKSSELIFERSPVISSHQIAWSGLSLEYHQQAPGETPQYLLVNPTISINVGKSSFIERIIDGKFQRDRFLKGQISIYPASDYKF
ncbi:MAG: hypothetical protein QNJ54_20330 [Prochloraceae cyanobacterium]|nr:hypothetical protein [Prochloraceae cyanobacterium]